MAIINDPTFLMNGNSDSASTPGQEITIDTTAKTIKINTGVGDLPLAADGVTFQALYSAFKLLWKNSSTFIKFPFPFESITPEQFEVINGWTFLDVATRKSIRTAGWAERNLAGAIVSMYAGVVSLGSLGATDQPYFQQQPVGSPTNFTFSGPVNEAVQFYSDPNGDGSVVDGYDYRTYMKVFAREQQKTYAQAALSDIGVTSMTYITYRFPLANSTDLKVQVNDTTLLSQTATYGGITIEYFATNQTRTIGGLPYNYRVIINGNNKPAETIYTKVQYLLRQVTDIDSSPASIIGKTADALLRFLGDSLITGNGVYIDNFDANDTNRITFTDQGGVGRTFPFVAAGNLLFNANLFNDPSAVYAMYFSTNPSGNFGTTNAILVLDGNNNPITGPITASTVPFSFNYDSNVQGGRTSSVDAAVTVVAIGLNTGQYVAATGNISRSTGQSISLTAALERNYANAA